MSVEVIQRRGRRREAAAYARISVRKLDQLLAEGQIPAARVGRAVVIDFCDVDRFLESRKTRAGV